MEESKGMGMKKLGQTSQSTLLSKRGEQPTYGQLDSTYQMVTKSRISTAKSSVKSGKQDTEGEGSPQMEDLSMKETHLVETSIAQKK